MKKFSQFVSELYNTNVVSIEKTHNDINKEEALNELNKNLGIAMAGDFVNIGEALHKVKKILSMYGIEIGEVNISNEDSGNIFIPINKFNSSGEGLSKVTGPGKENNETHSLKFNFSAKDGKYDVSAKVVKN